MVSITSLSTIPPPFLFAHKTTLMLLQSNPEASYTHP